MKKSHNSVNMRCMQAKFLLNFRVIRATMADSTATSKEASKDEKAAAKPNAGIPKAEFVVGLLLTFATLSMYGVLF